MFKKTTTNKNEDTKYQNLQDGAKTVFRGKFLAINANVKKKKKERKISNQ